MNEKTASVHWEGQGKGGGQNQHRDGRAQDYPYGLGSRFEDDRRVLHDRFSLPATAPGWPPAMSTRRPACASSS